MYSICLVMLTYTVFCQCDLDLDPMTLVYKNDLDNLKIYWCNKNEDSRSTLSKIRAQTRWTGIQSITMSILRWQ